MTVKRMDNVGIVVETSTPPLSSSPNLASSSRARPNRRRLGRWRHWIARHARRDCHDAYAGRSQPARDVPIPRAACCRRSPQRSGERSRLSTRHVHRGGHRRYARPARQTRRGARRRSGPVRRHVSALLHPGPRRNSHRACPRARAADFSMSTCDRYRPDRGVLAVDSFRLRASNTYEVSRCQETNNP